MKIMWKDIHSVGQSVQSFSQSFSQSFIWVKRKFFKPWNDVRLSSVTESFWMLLLVWHGHHRPDARKQQNRRAYNLSWESLFHFCKTNWKSDEFCQSMTRRRMIIIILWGWPMEQRILGKLTLFTTIAITARETQKELFVYRKLKRFLN